MPANPMPVVEEWGECDACGKVFAASELKEYCYFRGSLEEPPMYSTLCYDHHPDNYEGPEA